MHYAIRTHLYDEGKDKDAPPHVRGTICITCAGTPRWQRRPGVGFVWAKDEAPMFEASPALLVRGPTGMPRGGLAE